MEGNQERSDRRIVGGVDTHKDLHVAAVVDGLDRVLASQSFATTRHGYKQMLAWMRTFGSLQRVGIEATGTYGAGVLRYMQKAGAEVLEVTAPDKHDRRKRGKNDDLDAQNAAHAAFAGKRTVTPKSRDGMIESLRVLKACRKSAVAARRVALQMIQNTIVCAPDDWTLPIAASTRPSWAFRKSALNSTFPTRLSVEMPLRCRFLAEASGQGA
jgi:transposase